MTDLKLPRWLSALLLVLLTGGALTVGIVLDDGDGDGTPDTVTVHVNVKAGDGQPTSTVEAPAPAVHKTAANLEQDLRAPWVAPPPTAKDLVQAGKVQATVKPLPESGAVIGFRGCQTKILPVNYSSRNGARATWFVLHYTVSHNVPGYADMNAILALFSNSARQASSNFIIDAEGHCYYIVPIEAKAWTQAGGNPWAVSVEVIAFGDEGDYLGPAGYAKLRSVIQQVHQRTGIPMTRGQVTGTCTPQKAGIVQHKDFGLCGGGHVDITPFSIDAVLRTLALGAPAHKLTDRELRIVHGVRAHVGTGHSRRYWCHETAREIFRIRNGDRHGRPARRKILRRVWTHGCGRPG